MARTCSTCRRPKPKLKPSSAKAWKRLKSKLATTPHLKMLLDQLRISLDEAKANPIQAGDL